MNRSTGAPASSWAPTLARERDWPFNSNPRELALDGACIALLFTSTWALHQFPTIDRMVWLLADLSVVLLAVRRQKEFLDVCRSNAILLTWPLLAMLSSLWSLTPTFSLYHGVQLLTTVLVGFLLTILVRIERLLPLIVTALAAAGVLSLAWVVTGSGGVSEHGEWHGLFPHKNTMGSTMAFLIVTAVCLLLVGWRPKVMLGIICLGAFLLLYSRAGTPLVSLPATLAVLPVFLIVRRGIVPSALGLGLALMLAVGAQVSLEMAGTDLSASILRRLGKDETLTGRTILWDAAMHAYEARPLYGFGFKAWWSSEETDAGLVTILLRAEAGSFHNTFLEVAVAFGIIGPILSGVGLLLSLVTTLRAYVADGSFLMLWPLLAVVFITGSCFAETMLFTNHSFFQLIVVIAAATASRRLSELRSRLPDQAGYIR
jgi:exopolysaccharide production protein ExoQ